LTESRAYATSIFSKLLYAVPAIDRETVDPLLSRPPALAFSLPKLSQPNTLRVISARRGKGLSIVGFTGRTGGEMDRHRDLCLHAPSGSMPLIQQIPITAGHIICGLVEERLFPLDGS
jgi:D-sedoheptulose 7-phosphate isomerase